MKTTIWKDKYIVEHCKGNNKIVTGRLLYFTSRRSWDLRVVYTFMNVYPGLATRVHI